MQSNIRDIQRAAIYKAKRAKRYKFPKPTKPSSNSLSFNRLLALGYTSYRDYLKSYHWVFFKTKFYTWFKEKHGSVYCIRCGAKARFNLHHTTYVRLGKERFTDIELLCRECHRRHHGIG